MNTENPTPAGPAAEMQPHIGPVFDIKRFIWLRTPMMVVIALCLAIPSVIAAWFLVPVGYTATAQIQLLAQEPYVLSKASDGTPYNTYVSTQVNLITGNPVLSRVLDVPEIRSLPIIARQEDPRQFLKQSVHVQTSRGSEILVITCSMKKKEPAVRVLEEVVEAYMNYAMSDEASTGNERLAWLTQERDARQLELEAQLRKIMELQSTMGIPMVGQTPFETGEAELYNENLAEAEKELEEVQKAYKEANAQLSLIEGFIEEGARRPIFDLGVEDRVGTDARVSALRGEVVRLQAERASMKDVAKDNLPSRKLDEKRLANLRENLAEVELMVRREVLESMRTQQARNVDLHEKAVGEAQERVDKSKAVVEEYNGRIDSTVKQYAELQDLESKAAETRRILEEVGNNISKISVESNAPSRVRLIAPASVPGGGPDYMPRFMAMAVALVGSVGAAGAAGIVRELLDQQVRSSQDLARLTDLPVIATIPHLDEDAMPESVELARVVEQVPQSTMADAYRRVLARLLHPDRARNEAKTLLVVSPTRGDGKSSLACNLGIALARAGRRVLLVDVCYRRSSIEENFGLTPDEGLSEILGLRTTTTQPIRATGVRRLYVLGPGLSTEDLPGRLASRKMGEFLEQVGEQVDHIIVDTQPWLIMADARLITPIVGNVLVAVGARVSTLGMVRRCLQELREVDANVIGLVLNGVRRTVGGYMKENQNIYYGYGHESSNGHSNGKLNASVAAKAAAEPSEAPHEVN